MAENHSNLDIKHSIKVIKVSKVKQRILKAVGENQLITYECMYFLRTVSKAGA